MITNAVMICPSKHSLKKPLSKRKKIHVIFAVLHPDLSVPAYFNVNENSLVTCSVASSAVVALNRASATAADVALLDILLENPIFLPLQK